MAKNNTKSIIVDKAEEAYKHWVNSHISNRVLWIKANNFASLYGCTLKKLPQKRWFDEDGNNRIGETNGKIIFMRSVNNILSVFTFFHEIGHVVLHFNSKRLLNKSQMEHEADLFASIITSKLWPICKDLIDEIVSKNPVITNNKELREYTALAATEIKRGVKAFYRIDRFSYIPVIIADRNNKEVNVYMEFSDVDMISTTANKLYFKTQISKNEF
jgi:hypothetical protein